MKKIRLFSLKGGLELMDSDHMESLTGYEHIFYSFGEDFDHSVRMEFIEMKQKLGEGGFGSVFLAYDKLFNQEVAIKVLNFASQSAKNSHMITKEIEALSKLHHKNIVKLFDYFPLPKKQQLIVEMQYLKGGELDDFWKQQPMRQFSEKNTYALFLQLLNAIDYCHTSKIIHRDMKFQNVMLAEPPIYDRKGRIDASKVELKVVDFGIFGSIAGIRMENINCGSLKFMAPELLQGHMQSTPKIDIWSLGLMLHGLRFGFLPFNSRDRQSLEKQIISEELEYKHLKRIRTTSIKNEYRRHLNSILRKTSDDLIDLIEKMLMKDPEKRIDMIEIYEHPWMEKYRLKEERWSDEEQSASSSSRQSADSLEGSPAAENFDPEAQDVNGSEDQDSNSSPSPAGHADNDHGRAKKIHENNFLHNQLMFNIQEDADETTGNFVRVNLKPRKDTNNKVKLGGTMYGNNNNQQQVLEERRAGSKNSRKSNQSVRKHLSMKATCKLPNTQAGNANNAGIGYNNSGQAGEPPSAASGGLQIQRQSTGIDGQAAKYIAINQNSNNKMRNSEYANQQGTSSAIGKSSNARTRVSKRQSGTQLQELDYSAQKNNGDLLTPKKYSIDRMNSQNESQVISGMRSTNPSPRAIVTMGSNNEFQQLNVAKKQAGVKKKKSKIKQGSYGQDSDAENGLMPGGLKQGKYGGGRKHMGQSKKSSSIYFNDPQFERSIIKGTSQVQNRQNLRQRERLLKQSYIIDGPRESQIEQRHRVSSQALKPNGMSPGQTGPVNGAAFVIPPANYPQYTHKPILPTKDSVGSAQLAKRHSTKQPKKMAGAAGEFKSPDVNARRQLDNMLSAEQVQGEKRMAQSFYREGQSDANQLRFTGTEAENQSVEPQLSKLSCGNAQLRSDASKEYKFRQSDVTQPSSQKLNSRVAGKEYQNPKSYFGSYLFESQSPKNMTNADRAGLQLQPHQSSQQFAPGATHGQRKPPPESAHANIQERASVGYIAKNGGGLNHSRPGDEQSWQQARLVQAHVAGKKLPSVQSGATEAHILASEASQNQLQSLMGDRGGAGASRQPQQQQSLADPGPAPRPPLAAQGGAALAGVRRESMNTSQKIGINPTVQRIPRRDISFFKGNKPNNMQLDFSQNVVTGLSIEGGRNSTAGPNGYAVGKLDAVPSSGSPDPGISGATTAAATAKATLERSKTHENIKRNIAKNGAAPTNQKGPLPQHRQANAKNAIRFDDQINQQTNDILPGQIQSQTLGPEHQVQASPNYTTTGAVKPSYHQYINPESQLLATKKRATPFGSSAERHQESDQNQSTPIKLPDIKKAQVINEATPGYGIGTAQASRTQTQIVVPTMNLQLFQQNQTTTEKPSTNTMQHPATGGSMAHPPNGRQGLSQNPASNAPSRQANCGRCPDTDHPNSSHLGRAHTLGQGPPTNFPQENPKKFCE